MSYAFLDVKIGGSPSSRIIIEIYEKDAPKTCRFFKSLLNHSHGYKGTRFHRIIEEFMIQGGDVKIEDTLIGVIPDVMENVGHPVDKRGLVGLARTSAAENSAQFFITSVPADHLRGVHTIFGNVVKGFEVVEKISQVEVDDSDNPTPGNEVVIVMCGELQPRKTRQSPSRRSVSPPSAPKTSNDNNGKSRERSRSPQRESDRHRKRSRSPALRRDEHRPRRSSDHHNGHERRHHHHHHHHRNHHRSPRKEDVLDAKHPSRNRSKSSERKGLLTHQESGNAVNDSMKIPTAPRGYKARSHYRPESSYGRLGYDIGYDDDIRDDEYRLREVERRREGERANDEPAVTFKGRGAMKYRERY